MATEVYVYADLSGKPHFVGRLWVHSKGNRESATFQYDQSWLSNPLKYSLEPALALSPAPFHTTPDKRLFGALGDSAPDRWGRMLMSRAVRIEAEKESSQPQTLREIDYLLRVNDFARQGALRFSLEEGGEFFSNDPNNEIPLTVSLPELLNASDSVQVDGGDESDLEILLAPGSSLGGARPKASVFDQTAQSLLLAKFPRRDDEYDEVTWEAVTMELAQNAGIRTENFRLVDVKGRPVILIERFDRSGSIRVPFLSGMSMINSADHEKRSYLELAEAITRYGATPKHDLVELWNRIVFNVLVTNIDDHMRNHGFLYQGTNGWSLSPAYDINPSPAHRSRRILANTIDFDNSEATIENAMSVYSEFGLNLQEAKDIVLRIANAVEKWNIVAKEYSLSNEECAYMETAFRHSELDVALNMN